ncbi:THUMP domain-containing protein [[Eubacterium] cellulosolvens]
MNSKLFFLLSGKHPTLPAAEVLAILEAEELEYEKVSTNPKILTLNSNPKCLQSVKKRSGMCEVAGNLIFQCKNSEDQIINEIKKIDFSEYFDSKITYSVRISTLFGSSGHINKMKMERELGRIIESSSPIAKVDLKHPDKEFIGIGDIDHFFFGLKKISCKVSSLKSRTPKLRPALHPSTIDPMLARCFVNLARAKIDEILLDPFCGVGGILIEGGLLGCQIVGSDLDYAMINKANTNLRYYGLDGASLLIADARMCPYDNVDSIATDPPYGRGSSTMGIRPQKLIKEFFIEVKRILSRDGYICIASPINVDIKNIGLDSGLNIIEGHIIRVHKSLVRELVVFNNK